MELPHTGTLYGVPRLSVSSSMSCVHRYLTEATCPVPLGCAGIPWASSLAPVIASGAKHLGYGNMRSLLRHRNTKDETKADRLCAKRPTLVNAKRVRHLSQPSVADFTELKGKSKQVNVDATNKNEFKFDSAPITPGAIDALPLGLRSPLYRVAKPTMERAVVLPSFCSSST